MPVFFKVVETGKLIEGFAAETERDRRGKFHVAQRFVDAADVLDFHVGQLGKSLPEKGITEIAFGIIGRVLNLAPGFDVTDKTGVV